MSKFNQTSIKKDFPILSKKIGVKPLTYLDNAATSHKPQVVIDAISKYYTQFNSNVHRGVHQLSDESTHAWEESKQVVADFFGAQKEELIITRNATEAINGVAYGWADHILKKGDVVLSTMMEHHANFVVWQEACKRTGATFKTVRVTNDGLLDLEDLAAHLKSEKVKLIAVVHVSNTLGTVNPVEKIVKLAKKYQARVMLDAAQSAPHMALDFSKLKVDFLAFSGHKMLGPMGVGGLIVKKELLESNQMRPWLFGGGMIGQVSPQNTSFNPDINDRFTPGTPDVASLYGLAAACQYLQKIGMENVYQHDLSLVKFAIQELSKLPFIKIVGPTNLKNNNRLASVTFMYKGVHGHDVAQILNSEGLAVRSGHHCTMPLHIEFGWQATIRASFQVYTSIQDIKTLVKGLKKVSLVFKV